MAIYRKISAKDIKQYEPNFIGSFTIRQTLCGGGGIALGLITFFSTNDYLGDLSFLLSMVIALPLLALGFYKPHGVPLEKFLKVAFVPLFLAPTKRKYVTELTLSVPKDTKKNTKSSKKKKSKNPEFKEI